MVNLGMVTFLAAFPTFQKHHHSPSVQRLALDVAMQLLLFRADSLELIPEQNDALELGEMPTQHQWTDQICYT